MVIIAPCAALAWRTSSVCKIFSLTLFCPIQLNHVIVQYSGKARSSESDISVASTIEYTLSDVESVHTLSAMYTRLLATVRGGYSGTVSLRAHLVYFNKPLKNTRLAPSSPNAPHKLTSTQAKNCGVRRVAVPCTTVQFRSRGTSGVCNICNIIRVPSMSLRCSMSCAETM